MQLERHNSSRTTLKNSLRPFLLCAVLFFSLLGCQQQEVAFDLSQKQSNEIVTTLSEHGISAEAVRGTGSKGKFVVSVPSNQYSEAVSILVYSGLPKVEEPSLNELLQSKGFLSNSKELEQLRIDRAKAAEIENLIKANPAVHSAQAVFKRPFFDGIGPPPSSSVSIIVTSNPDQTVDVEVLKQLVLNLIPGLSSNNLVILSQPVNNQVSGKRDGIYRDSKTGKVVSIPMRSFYGWFRVADGDYQTMLLVIVLSLLGFLIIGLIAGFSLGFLGKKVVTSKANESLGSLRSDRPTLTIGGE